MTPLDPNTLWSDTDRTRFFLIPDEQQLAPGDFVIRTITGRKQEVDPASLAPFELSEEEAKKWLEHQFGSMLDSARGAVERFAEKLSGADADRVGNLRRAVSQLETAVDRFVKGDTSASVVDAMVLVEIADRLHEMELRLCGLATEFQSTTSDSKEMP